MNAVNYLEPVRATAQRYYRRQELAVNEIDSAGENVPFFLDNLRPYEKRQLDEWLKKHLGIQVQTEGTGGHIAIRIRTVVGGPAVNLADTGFGYSQLLPIALQLWRLTTPDWERQRASKSENQILVIEQPELHLHPAFQAKLADIFAACVSEENMFSENQLQLIVETHSPSLINRLGELIATKQLDRQEVQVILFEKNEREGGVSSTRFAEFDEEGSLQNWPYGFFEPTDDLSYISSIGSETSDDAEN
jgi:predicted ATPase